MEHRVLIIEDEEDLADIISEELKREGFQVRHAGRGSEGVALAEETKPHLVLLDMMLPDIGGLEVCRILRTKEALRGIPILFLTGQQDEAAVVRGLNAGGDDYITKPFRTQELVARIRAAIRRAESTDASASKNRLGHGPFTLDVERFEARVNERLVPLTLAEFALLRALVSLPGRVFSREQLIDRISGGEANVVDRTVDVHIGALRKKLGPEGAHILTVRGLGYKLQE